MSRTLTIAAIGAATLAIGAAPAQAEPAVALLPGNQIVTFDTATPQTVTGPIPVTGLGSAQTLRGIDFRPGNGQLFGVAFTTGSANNSATAIYAIDPGTGAATLVGSVGPAVVPGLGDVPAGVDFNSVVDRIRYSNVNDEHARFNPNNGALAGDDSNITPAATTDIVGSAYDRNTYMAPPFGPVAPPAPAGPQTTLYEIDRNGNSLGVIGGPNGGGPGGANGGMVTDSGPLGVTLDASRDAGFDITPGGTAYAALSVGGVTSLYTINLPGSRATAVGPIGGGETEVYGLTVATDPDGDGLVSAVDNCPGAANADQADLDADGAGDACDPDQDGDGLSDAFEAAIGSDPRSINSDGDGTGDSADACPALAGGTPNGCPDIALPDTTITKVPKRKTTKRKATLEFTATEPGATFACSLDHKPFVLCGSPQTYKRLKVGKHFADVRAIDTAGNLDPTPATAAWRIKPKK